MRDSNKNMSQTPYLVADNWGAFPDKCYICSEKQMLDKVRTRAPNGRGWLVEKVEHTEDVLYLWCVVERGFIEVYSHASKSDNIRKNMTRWVRGADGDWNKHGELELEDD